MASPLGGVVPRQSHITNPRNSGQHVTLSGNIQWKIP
ncbi:MAG: hypothetical protein UR31_C0009G0006 [Parcubacteria group bacterium GW2011_GWA2_33_14]|nr:MAG: hypothetical protein UR31_C0009G0006 [Parcubacteria group bacterium GW2011_GWA2_33_14]